MSQKTNSPDDELPETASVLTRQNLAANTLDGELPQEDLLAWKALPKPDFRIANALWNSAVLTGVITSCGAVVAIATFRHVDRFDALSIAFACVWCLGACVIPIWFKPLLRNGGTYQLAVITWRLLALLPAMAWGMAQTGASRNSFMTTLMACYFLTLPLESWLLVRDAQRSRPS